MVFTSTFESVSIPSIPLVEYLFDAFKHFGDRIALIQAETGRKVTFNELKESVLLVSKGLIIQHNVQKGDFVAIVSPNLIEFCISFLSLVHIGAIPVLINPLLHVDEFIFHFSKFNPKMIMTTSAFLNKVEESIIKVHSIQDIVLFDRVDPIPLKNGKKAIPFSLLIKRNTQTPDLPSLDIDPKKYPSVIVLSSGTTGVQKGVVLSHYNLISNIDQAKKALEDSLNGVPQVVSLNLPIFHVYGLSSVLLYTLRLGGTAVLMEKFVLEQYLEFLSKYKVTFAYVVPPIALLLVKTPLIKKYDLSSLRNITSGAAPLDMDLQNELKKKTGAIVVQGYGLSEASPVTHAALPSSPLGSVGALFPNMEAKIVDPLTNKELSHDEIGELWVKGPNIMLGYYNDKESTDMAIDSEGFLHTGDIAKVDSNGYFYIVDRIKDLIKFNAYQVAPAELEGLLLTHPLINDVAVVGKPDLKHGELPTAFVVKKAGSELTEKEIVEFVSERTSPYKRLRGGVIFVDAIQKSPSGKILRRLMKQQMIDNMKKLQAKL